jgi:hypothetical protein
MRSVRADVAAELLFVQIVEMKEGTTSGLIPWTIEQEDHVDPSSQKCNKLATND